MNKKIMTIVILSMFILVSTITVSASDNTYVSTNSSSTCISWKYVIVRVHNSSGAVVQGATVSIEQWHFLRHNYASGQTNIYGEVRLIVITNYYTTTKIHASFGNEYADLYYKNTFLYNQIDIYLHPGTTSNTPGPGNIPPTLPDEVVSQDGVVYT